MNTNEILNASKTKTWKIEQLILAGFSRTQIAQMVTNGNYGFVQNVYAKMKREGRLTLEIVLSFEPTIFDRKFGVEIEGYGITRLALSNMLNEAGINCEAESYNHTTRTNWKVITDGSLTGTNTFEIVSPILEGADGLEQLRKVCEILEVNNVKVNKSCGLHIHFDASQIGNTQMKNIILNYIAYEEHIDSFLPLSRRGETNYYCQSLKSYKEKIKNASTIEKMISIFRGRYFKLNLQSYTRHNTIEFRQHSGTVEFEKISNWIYFLHNLVSYSANNLANENPDFDSIKNFNQPEIFNYLVRRQNQLNS